MFKRTIITLCCVLLFAVVFVKADALNQRTVMTFSQPVEMPGFVLPAGTYVFKLLESPWNRHIVQVFSADEKHLYGTVMAIPNYRLTPTGDKVVKFAERPIDTPVAIRAWFYPGDNYGQEFVYPKARATHLAEETKQPVLAAAITPEQKPEEMIAQPVETFTPAPEPVTIAQVEAPAEPELIAGAPALPAPELPKTASPIPLVGLMGVSSLALAVMLRRVAKTDS
jgi:hypothetical protein